MYKRIVLVLILVFGLSVVTCAGPVEEISRDLSQHADKVYSVLDRNSDSGVSRLETLSLLEMYKLRAHDLYVRSLQTDSEKFIKAIAGYSMAIELFFLGTKERQSELLEAGNMLLEHIVLPQLKLETE